MGFDDIPDLQAVLERVLNIDAHRELAALTGAEIYLGAQARAGFPHVAVHDGDELRFGNCVLRFLETRSFGRPHSAAVGGDALR
jgi:hypothetical protein